MVFCPNDAQDHQQKQPISLKKLEKGDDGWSIKKVILSWLVDFVSKTISLPQHRQEPLHSILQAMLRRKRASVQEWQWLLGELQSMSLTLPGSKGCFSILQVTQSTESRLINKFATSCLTSSGSQTVSLHAPRILLKLCPLLLPTLARWTPQKKAWAAFGSHRRSLPSHWPSNSTNPSNCTNLSCGEHNFHRRCSDSWSHWQIPLALSLTATLSSLER